MATPASLEIEMVAIDSVAPYEGNARTHSSEQVAQIVASIREYGWTAPILFDDQGIIAGHGRIMAARLLEMAEVPAIRLTGLSDAQRKAYILADNAIALNAGWDEALLHAELTALRSSDFDLGLVGFDVDAVRKVMGKGAGKAKPDDVPAVPEAVTSLPGDVWLLGHHRVACLDSTSEAAKAFFGKVDLVATDPPYCSGGFQESSKSVGSVGTAAKHKQIANDRLSTRGYQALIKAAIFGIDAEFFYVFTDWRMWTYLFDLAEASGAGVRSMIVWNKGTAGMGLGWRAQHELVLWAAKVSPPYPKGFAGMGNVQSISRQQNDLHTTQKPVELVRQLLQNAPFAKVIAEPFCGSGTTLIACEQEGMTCRGTELDASYVDVAVLRWQEFTGAETTLESTGQTFAQVRAERLGE